MSLVDHSHPPAIFLYTPARYSVSVGPSASIGLVALQITHFVYISYKSCVLSTS